MLAGYRGRFQKNDDQIQGQTADDTDSIADRQEETFRRHKTKL